MSFSIITTNLSVPKEIQELIDALKRKSFESYIVGGSLRDLVLGRDPQDWDLATSAKPQEILQVFGKKAFLDNRFGTVKVKTGSSKKELEVVEITPFRKETEYKDHRHPEKIVWSQSIQEDLARRDFTINAMAATAREQKIVEVIDPFGGQRDLQNKLLRAVGDPYQRFEEDALRLMRAVRLKVQLGEEWQIEKETWQALKEKAPLLERISQERIRDELIKILETPRAAQGIDLLREAGLLRYIIPELEEGVGVSQNKHHIYDVYEHNLRSLDYTARQGWSWQVRLASLLHDIGKPRTKKGEGPEATFYGHEVVGARMTEKILRRLRFSNKDTERIVKLVRYHLFYYDVGEVTEAGVRRLLRKVGRDLIDDLLKVRQADRIGSGCPKALPYRLRHLMYMIEKVSQDPLHPKMLKVKGEDVMTVLEIPPSRKVGEVLDILLAEVIEDPKRNTRAHLIKRLRELKELSDKEISALAQKAREEINKVEQKRDEMTKQRYWVS